MSPTRARLLALPIFLLGLITIIITPPFQVADENTHYFRAYQLSEGTLFGEKIGRHAGGSLPKLLSDDVARFSYLPFHEENKVSRENLGEAWRKSEPLEFRSTQTRVYTEFPNTVLYSPIPYLPQALAITLSRAAGMRNLSAFYLARFFTLLTVTALVTLAFGYASFSARALVILFALIAIPMDVFQISSISADAITGGLAFFLIALALRLRLKWNERQFLVFLLASVALSLCKSVYFCIPMVLLPTLFQFPGRERAWRILVLAACCLIPAVLWTWATQSLMSEMRYGAVTDAHAQMRFFLSHPVKLTWIFVKNLCGGFSFYKESFVGILGWLDAKLHPRVLDFYFKLLFLLPLIGPETELVHARKSASDRTVWAGILLFTTFLICLSQYLNWIPVGLFELDGVVGRYFIPLSAVFFFMLPQLISLKARPFRAYAGTVALVWVYVAGRYTMTLLHRYWM